MFSGQTLHRKKLDDEESIFMRFHDRCGNFIGEELSMQMGAYFAGSRKSHKIGGKRFGNNENIKKNGFKKKNLKKLSLQKQSKLWWM